MKVNIVNGSRTDINIKNCYDILAVKARKELYRDSNLCKGFNSRANVKGLRPKQSD